MPAASLRRERAASRRPGTADPLHRPPPRLRSDGDQLAAALRSAGVQVSQRTWSGVTHEFFGMGAVVDKAKEAVRFGAAGLRRGFGT